jgi:uncharacterized protein
MQFNVSSLLREPAGTMREYEIDDDIVVEGERQHLTGQVRFDRTPRGILVRARMHGDKNDECSRCLKPLSYGVDIEVEEEYFPTVDINSGTRFELEEGEDPDAYRIDTRHVIDLAVPAREYWSIALPMAPVCSEDCPGLCPECGADRTAGEHVCRADQGDARWSKLADLQLG